MEFVPEEEDGSLSAAIQSIVLPALSIGNVGQLAVDLLISSTCARRVGYLDEPSLIPCVGNDAYGPHPSGELALPLEAYESRFHELDLIQQRSPVIKGLILEFARNMASFIESTGKQHVIILSSVESGKRKRIDTSEFPSTEPIYYISSISDDGTDEDCEKLCWKRLEHYNPHRKRWKYLMHLAEGNLPTEDELDTEDEFDEDDYYSSLPFAALLYCCKVKGLKVTCILCYCSEGDNIPDSFRLAEAACKFLGLNPNKLPGNEKGSGGFLIPLSWKTVYGPPPDISLF